MPNLNVAYQWAINKCNEANIGYSQDYRNQQTVNGVTYYDCSSFIWYALLAGGFDVKTAYRTATGETYSGNAIWTAVERDWLRALGFVEQNIQGTWQAGDILWRSGHTEMVYSGGAGSGVTMGAHSSHRPLADQVSINSSASSYTSWTSLWRYGSTPAVTDVSLYVIAAICGNFYQESQINPGFWEGLQAGTPTTLLRGYGLGQWTNTQGDTQGRLYQLMDWLDDNNYSRDSGDGQMNYLMYENVWYKIGYATGYDKLTDFLLSDSTDLAALTRAWCSGWEGLTDNNDPSITVWEQRIAYAQQFYDYLLLHYADPDIVQWIAGNRYLTNAESNNNAVMLYRFFDGLIPPSPSPTPSYGTKKMPVWMMLRPYF